MKMFESLQTKYLLLIFCALVMVPISIPFISMLVYLPAVQIEGLSSNPRGEEIEKEWHELAGTLSSDAEEQLMTSIASFQEQHPTSDVYWVDEDGETRFRSSDASHIPASWDPTMTVAFMKESYGGDPFTTVAFVGQEYQDGFIIFQVDRTYFDPPIQRLSGNYTIFLVFGILLVFGFFIFISWLFFRRIQKRLLRLQSSITDSAGVIPNPVKVGTKDEIGQLERSFNEMVQQLEESRKREQEEERLRRELIANLSHDLRTPLTTIRAHSYSLSKEQLSEEGQQSMLIIDKKIAYVSRLIDNLLSYTLLAAGKYSYNPESVNVTRLVREAIAAWYPHFEKEDFEIEIDLNEEEKEVVWFVDRNWLERILDNLFQNVSRHASSGKYIGVRLLHTSQGTCISISDKGLASSSHPQKIKMASGLA